MRRWSWEAVRATSSIPHSNRAPAPKGTLPRQLSSGLGRLLLDSLQGALLFFPHGGAVGPQGGAAALPERWVSSLAQFRDSEVPRKNFTSGHLSQAPLRFLIHRPYCDITENLTVCKCWIHTVLHLGCCEWGRWRVRLGEGLCHHKEDLLVLTWAFFVSSRWDGSVHS